MKADTENHMHSEDTILQRCHVKLEITLMLSQIILMDIEERQFKLAMFTKT